MRIRLLEDDAPDKYKILLPDENKNFPIGLVWKDNFKTQGWKVKVYFPIYSRSEQYDLERQIFDDFMKAARDVANCYKRNSNLSFYEENEYGFVWPDATD